MKQQEWGSYHGLQDYQVYASTARVGGTSYSGPQGTFLTYVVLESPRLKSPPFGGWTASPCPKLGNPQIKMSFCRGLGF